MNGLAQRNGAKPRKPDAVSQFLLLRDYTTQLDALCVATPLQSLPGKASGTTDNEDAVSPEPPGWYLMESRRVLTAPQSACYPLLIGRRRSLAGCAALRDLSA